MEESKNSVKLYQRLQKEKVVQVTLTYGTHPDYSAYVNGKLSEREYNQKHRPVLFVIFENGFHKGAFNILKEDVDFWLSMKKDTENDSLISPLLFMGSAQLAKYLFNEITESNREDINFLMDSAGTIGARIFPLEYVDTINNMGVRLAVQRMAFNYSEGVKTNKKQWDEVSTYNEKTYHDLQSQIEKATNFQEAVGETADQTYEE